MESPRKSPPGECPYCVPGDMETVRCFNPADTSAHVPPPETMRDHCEENNYSDCPNFLRRARPGAG